MGAPDPGPHLGRPLRLQVLDDVDDAEAFSVSESVDGTEL
jgi:hypothetical protein